MLMYHKMLKEIAFRLRTFSDSSSVLSIYFVDNNYAHVSHDYVDLHKTPSETILFSLAFSASVIFAVHSALNWVALCANDN